MRRIIPILIGALLPLTALPAVASASSAPVVNYAKSVDDDLGTLEISAAAETGITELRAHIVSFATGQDVAVADRFTLVSGTVQNGIWHTPEPIQLDELNVYRIDVEVTDADGQRITRTDAGTFAYIVITSFSPLRANPSTVTYSHRTVVVSATLTGIWPGTREIKPIPGVEVFTFGGVGQPVSATTAADGSFAATLEVEGTQTIRAEFCCDPNNIFYIRANSDPLEIPISPAKTRVTAQASRTTVHAGESLTVSGRLTWRSPDGWQPLASKQVGVLFCVGPDSCGSVDFPVTDADGRYQLTVTPYESGHYRVGWPSHDPFIANALTTTADILVLQPAEFTDFDAARDAAGNVVAHGHMRFGNFTPDPIPVQIQFKANGSRTWTTVATVDNAQWDGTGYAFSATVDHPASGRWRAVYAGGPHDIESAVSAVISVT